MSFDGLPTTLVNELLEKSVRVAEQVYEPYGGIVKNRDAMRSALLEKNVIRSVPALSEKDMPVLCGVTGFSTIENFFTSDLAFSVVFGMEGIVPPSGKRHWMSPSHQILFYPEKHVEETPGIMNAVMMEMAVELAAQAPHDVILYGDSLIKPFALIMDALKPALEQKELSTSQEFLSRLKTFILSYKTMFESSDSGRIWVGMPYDTAGSGLAQRMGGQDRWNDSVLFTLLLLPGEYVVPMTVEQSEVVRIKNLPIKDEKLSVVRDNLVSLLGQLQVMYFRPKAWTTALRIEIYQGRLGAGGALDRLLSGIAYQCAAPGIREPYPIYSARQMVRNIQKAMPSLYQSLITQITHSHRNDMEDSFPLFLLK